MRSLTAVSYSICNEDLYNTTSPYSATDDRYLSTPPPAAATGTSVNVSIFKVVSVNECMVGVRFRCVRARKYLTRTPLSVGNFSIENLSPNFEAVYKNGRCHLDIAYVKYEYI